MKAVVAFPETELIRHFVSGDDSAFTKIYNKYYFAVYQHALRWLADRQDAEDITADTFVKLWNNRSRFSSQDEISGFLHVTTRNACYDFLKHANVVSRKQGDLIQWYESGEKADENASEIWEEFAKVVYSKVDKMPKRMREIFLLSYEQGLKPAEIAEKLNLSVQTVSNQKYAAINLLKVAVGDNIPFILILIALSAD